MKPVTITYTDGRHWGCACSGPRPIFRLALVIRAQHRDLAGARPAGRDAEGPAGGHADHRLSPPIIRGVSVGGRSR